MGPPRAAKVIALGLGSGLWLSLCVLDFAALQTYKITPGAPAVVPARTRCEVNARVVFFKPGGTDEEWERTDLWHAAVRIRGVQVRSDGGGALARHLGVSTSGHVVLYDSTGQMLFSGGITRSRGRAGDNAGHRALLA